MTRPHHIKAERKRMFFEELNRGKKWKVKSLCPFVHEFALEKLCSLVAAARVADFEVAFGTAQPAIALAPLERIDESDRSPFAFREKQKGEQKEKQKGEQKVKQKEKAEVVERLQFEIPIVSPRLLEKRETKQEQQQGKEGKKRREEQEQKKESVVEEQERELLMIAHRHLWKLLWEEVEIEPLVAEGGKEDPREGLDRLWAEQCWLVLLWMQLSKKKKKQEDCSH